MAGMIGLRGMKTKNKMKKIKTNIKKNINI